MVPVPGQRTPGGTGVKTETPRKKKKKNGCLEISQMRIMVERNNKNRNRCMMLRKGS